MRIVIVKLHNRQANIIAEEFPDLDLTVITEDSVIQAKAQAASADVLVIMTRFIGHSLFKALPHANKFLCKGGLTELRKQLCAFRSAQPVVQPVVQPVTDTCFPIEDFPMDYRSLKTAKVGDVLLFPRPAGITLKVFETRVLYVRSYYKKQHGVDTVQNTTDNGIEILITDRKPKKLKKSKFDKLAVKHPDIFEAKEDQKGDGFLGGQIIREPATDFQVTRQFWRDVFLSTLGAYPGRVVEATETADTALTNYQRAVERIG